MALSERILMAGLFCCLAPLALALVAAVLVVTGVGDSLSGVLLDSSVYAFVAFLWFVVVSLLVVGMLCDRTDRGVPDEKNSSFWKRVSKNLARSQE